MTISATVVDRELADTCSSPAASDSTRVGQLCRQGATIGRYVVLGLVGQGGMGVVYRAYDPSLNREVAIKLLRPDKTKRVEAAETRLRREAQAMARISHPHVLPVYDVGVFAGRVFVAMEFVTGRTVGEWVREERPSWQDIVDTFVLAGKGLAAAHEVGLIHRDFKPHNVLLGEDGRPRVMDFGLARIPMRSTLAAEGDPADSTPSGWSSDDGCSSLTATGSVVGTPRYMAPEQHRGPDLDARADQFCFCAAMYEALYRVRPFGGGNVKRIGRRKVRGELEPPPADTKVPLRIREILERGLSPEPEQRWPDMNALLAALVSKPDARRLSLFVLPAAGTLVAAFLGFAGTSAQGSECTDAAARFVEVWGEGRRAAVHAGLMETDLGYAAQTWERVEPRVNDYIERWKGEYNDACEATHDRKEQSPELMDLRMACLEHQRQQLDASLDLMASADEPVVRRAVQSVDALPDPRDCSDVLSLLEQQHLPADPELRERVQGTRSTLARAAAMNAAGKYEEADSTLEPIVSATRGLGYRPLLAEVLAEKATAASGAGRPRKARELAQEAFDEALAGRAGRQAVRVAIHLVHVEGHGLANAPDAKRWAKTARALIDAHGTTPLQRADLLNNEGIAFALEGNHKVAESKFDEAISVLRREEPGSPKIASVAANAAALLAQAGRHDDARRWLREALEHRRVRLGPAHPAHLAQAANLGALELTQGRYEEARLRLTDVLQRQERMLGEQHPEVANTLSILGAAHRSLGDNAEALASFQRALAIREHVLGDESLEVAGTLDDVARALWLDGDTAAAREAFERASAIFDHEDQSPDYVSHLLLGAGLDNAAGEVNAAAHGFRRAASDAEALLGGEHPLLVQALGEWARFERDRDEREIALEQAERALDIARKGGAPRPLIAETRLILASLLWEAERDRPRAVALVELARHELSSGIGRPDQRDELVRWLQSHRIRG